MPDTWKNGEHVDHDPIVEARAAHLMGHQRRVARGAVAIQTGCRAACREQTAADVLEARKALLLFLSVRRGVYERPRPVPIRVCSSWPIYTGGDEAVVHPVSHSGPPGHLTTSPLTSTPNPRARPQRSR